MSVNPEKNQSDFIQFALEAKVLSFGEFKTKAGRLSPYFFNAGLFNDGAQLGKLGEFYAQALLGSNIDFDMLFGPAYKGITLAASTAIALARSGRNTPFAYNRKEAKDHGEGGTLIGAPVRGRVVIIDDVISAGTSVQSVGQEFGLPVIAIANLEGLMHYLQQSHDQQLQTFLPAVQDYRNRYGI